MTEASSGFPEPCRRILGNTPAWLMLASTARRTQRRAALRWRWRKVRRPPQNLLFFFKRALDSKATLCLKRVLIPTVTLTVFLKGFRIRFMVNWRCCTLTAQWRRSQWVSVTRQSSLVLQWKNWTAAWQETNTDSQLLLHLSRSRSPAPVSGLRWLWRRRRSDLLDYWLRTPRGFSRSRRLHRSVSSFNPSQYWRHNIDFNECLTQIQWPLTSLIGSKSLNSGLNGLLLHFFFFLKKQNVFIDSFTAKDVYFHGTNRWKFCRF